jgi:hypothetical protein
MLAGCSREPEPKPAASAAPVEKTDAGWPDFVASFIEARFKADPYFAVQAGRHEFDGKMPDWSRQLSIPKSPSCENSRSTSRSTNLRR